MAWINRGIPFNYGNWGEVYRLGEYHVIKLYREFERPDIDGLVLKLRITKQFLAYGYEYVDRKKGTKRYYIAMIKMGEGRPYGIELEQLQKDADEKYKESFGLVQ